METYRMVDEDGVEWFGVLLVAEQSSGVEQMTDRGWIEETEDGDLIYYAPDASVLLSEEFTQQHCFSAERTDEAILLRFEPNRGRSDIPEIEGAMSLDPRTRTLLRIARGATWTLSCHRERPSRFSWSLRTTS